MKNNLVKQDSRNYRLDYSSGVCVVVFEPIKEEKKLAVQRAFDTLFEKVYQNYTREQLLKERRLLNARLEYQYAKKEKGKSFSDKLWSTFINDTERQLTVVNSLI